MSKAVFGEYADSEGPNQTTYAPAESDKGLSCPLTNFLDIVNRITKTRPFNIMALFMALKTKCFR